MSFHMINIVYEFFANMHPSMSVKDSVNYGKVYVRGKWYLFTPYFINEIYDVENLDDEDTEVDLDKAICKLTGG